MWWKIVFNLFLPFERGMSRLTGKPVDGIERRFVQMNNRSVRRRNVRVEPSELMILLPQCMQFWDCPNKLTLTVDNCKRCGRCGVDSLVDIGEKYGVLVRMAIGGGAALRAIQERAPKAVVAIACERELTDGIRDVLPLPVLGILNERPEGPCKNTQADLAQVESAVKWFLNGQM
jgi:hypothetical protein